MPAVYQPHMVQVHPDGRAQCVVCGQMYSNARTAKTHVERLHLVPRLTLSCRLCQSVFRHKLDFTIHINRVHHIKGVKNVVKNYAKHEKE